jgi:triacylglycerol esterase/lipase EstA (alpha/beta hydrolase family)
LHGALIQECLLHGMQAVALREAFNSSDLFLGDIADLRNTGSARLAIDQDGTGTALTLAAAIFASCQIEMVAQDEEQDGVGIHFDGIDVPVDV